MKGLRHHALILALFALGTTPRPPIGFIDLARLVAVHPLHAVLLQYDRQVAALRSTQRLPGLGDPQETALTADAAQRSQTSTARAVVANVEARNAQSDRAREGSALARLRASQQSARDSLAAYSTALDRETSATLAAFEESTAQRNARAYAARAQQFREQEATLAFDLERANGGTRLALRLKLDDLRLPPPARAKVQMQLAALDAREQNAILAQRRRDSATLAAYRTLLVNQGAAANARMTAQLQAKAAANFAVRRRVAQNGAGTLDATALPNRLATFEASYRSNADAGAVDAGMRQASTDISQRFAALAAADARSRRDVSAQITTLEADRNALYRSIVAQILRTATRLAQQRGLAAVHYAGARPEGSVDLTAAVMAALTR